MTRCDGSVTFISNNVDQLAYERAFMRLGGESLTLTNNRQASGGVSIVVVCIFF